MDFIWELLIVVPVGICLLRLAGKKALSEMTIFEVITVLSIGTLISHGVVEEGAWKTVIAMCVIVLFLLISQYLQLKSSFFERVFVGKATIVIDNGAVVQANLKKLRMTVGQLEMRLREKGVERLQDVKMATIEANGQIGFELHEAAKPLTYGQFVEMMKQYNAKPVQPQAETVTQTDLFAKLH